MMNDRPVELDYKAVALANGDLSERLSGEGVSITYDDDGDTILIDIGEGGEAIADHFVNGMYVRIHPVTLKIVGCTVVGFVTDILAHNKLMRTLFEEDFQRLIEQGGKREWTGIEAQRTSPIFEAALSRHA